jgi:hypothetical protein
MKFFSKIKSPNIRSFSVFIVLIVLLVLYLLYLYLNNTFSFNNNLLESFSQENYEDINYPTIGNIFKYSKLNLNEYPNIEVKSDSNFLTANKFLPECCFYYSQYSSDKGCPCITPEQQYYLQRRGLNKDKNSFSKTNKIFSLNSGLKNGGNLLQDFNIDYNNDDKIVSDISLNIFNSMVNLTSR